MVAEIQIILSALYHLIFGKSDLDSLSGYQFERIAN